MMALQKFSKILLVKSSLHAQESNTIFEFFTKLQISVFKLKMFQSV